MRIVTVDDPYPALAKQHRLASQILVKVCMFSRCDMIGLNVGKNTIIKDKSLCAVHLEALRGRLHHYHLTARLFHFFKILLQIIRLGRRMRWRNHFLSDNCLDGSHQTDLISCSFQNILDKVRCRRLSLRACHTDDLHALCRIAKIVCREKRHRITGVLHLDHRDVRPCRKRYLLTDHKHRSTFVHCLCRRCVPIKICALYAYKETVLCNLSRVLYYLRYLNICTAFDTFIFKASKQLPALNHITHPPLWFLSLLIDSTLKNTISTSFYQENSVYKKTDVFYAPHNIHLFFL